MGSETTYGERIHPVQSKDANDPVDCPLCDATLTNQWIYKNHLLKRHPLQCHFCHTRFEVRWSCQRHIRGYEDGPVCFECGIKLPSRTCFTQHYLKYHNHSYWDCCVQDEVQKRRLISWEEDKDRDEDEPPRMKFFGQYCWYVYNCILLWTIYVLYLVVIHVFVKAKHCHICLSLFWRN